MSTAKIVWLSILGLIAIIILGCAIELGTGYFGVFYTKTVGKAKQNAEREVFKETQSYNDGMAQQLSKLKFEYETTKDSTDKAAIRYKIIHDYADFNTDNLQDESLKNWLRSMK